MHFCWIKNNDNGKTLVLHKHYSNSIDSIINLARQELSIKNPQDIRGFLFTTNMRNYEESGTKSRHQGKSQLEELKFLKDSLINAFNIQDRTQITANKFTSNLTDGQLGDYEFAELSVLVDSHLQLKSICVMHEGIFGDFSSIPLDDRVQYTIRLDAEKAQQLLRQHFLGKVTNEQLNSYNNVHFEKL